MDGNMLRELGIGIVAIIIMYLIVKMVLAQWSKSTDAQIETNKTQSETAQALEKNAKSYEKLAAVFEKSHDREIEFQREVISSLKDTNSKVNDIHKKIV